MWFIMDVTMIQPWVLLAVGVCAGGWDDTQQSRLPRVTVMASAGMPRQAEQVAADQESWPEQDKARFLRHLFDPSEIEQYTEEDLRDGANPDKSYYERLIARIQATRRPKQLRLTLDDAMMRMLEYGFALKVARYNPAIEATRVIEAQAVYDATLFSNVSKFIQDRPTASQLAASDFDRFSWETGIRKILPIGMQVSTSYSLERQSTSLSFQQLNPQYFSQLNLGLTQPLLRGFGLDYHRSAIVIASNNRRISDYEFRKQVRQSLRDLEQAFWQLAQARRDIVISARLLEKFESIYNYLVDRRDFDVTQIQIEETRANLETSRADFLRVLANVRNAEDRIVFLLNDPTLNLADDVEIIPEGLPILSRILVDRIGEMQSALENRQEIAEAQLLVANARIGVGQARNETLPRLDLSFNYAIDGLGKSADRSFDELSRNNFNEYTIGVVFEMPIGNRGAKARLHRARLSLAQAEERLRQQTELVLTEVNVAIRELDTTYSLIKPRLESVEAGQRQLEAIEARADRKDFPQLNAELGARNSLAVSRRQLLQALVDYQMSIISLEASKGTLARYNNVMFEDELPAGAN